MIKQGMRVLGAWASVPFRSTGRRGFAWYVSSGVAETVKATGTLPSLSWSQDGEDFVFDELLPATGFYVDVGAHHPDRYSVTRKLYDKGWHGINIDFSPDFDAVFGRRRPRDINVSALVGREREETFWRFREATLSTLDADRARQLVDLGWELESQEPMTVTPLTRVLEQHGVTGPIDLLSVDVEGEDLEVIKSLDWSRWPVERCLVEIVLPAYEVGSHPVAQFLEAQGLKLTRVWGRSCLFERDFQHDPLDRG